MNNYELSQLLNFSLKQAERDSRKNFYLLKLETIKKIETLEDLLESCNCNISFDAPTNSVEISASAFVFDNAVCNLKRAFDLVDLFVIDAADDGKVCIEMKIFNAAETIGRNRYA